MEDRRSFLQKGAMAAVALSLPATPGCLCFDTIGSKMAMKTRKINRALVAWYSQTGNTERNGKLLAVTMQANGVQVTSGCLKDIDKTKINGFDLIVIGSPVFYYDTPNYVKQWIRSLPDLAGTPVAAYVTFGGPEGNQHNAACSILECLVEKQGVPVAKRAFMNMGTYPLSWAGKESTWRIRGLPNREAYKAVREFAVYIISEVKKGNRKEFTKSLTMREIAIYLGPIYWTKRSIEEHYIDRKKCIECGTCEDKCPVQAIDLVDYSIDHDACVLCFGCLNNCPTQAMHMQYDGKPLIGYKAFMKLRRLKVIEPEGLPT